MVTGDDDWAEAEAAARRVISARVRGVAERDDLVQETLARLQAARDRLSAAELVPYAITTARNLVFSEYRRARRRDTLWSEVPTSPTHEEDVERLDEARALRAALDRLSPPDRELLLKRDAYDVPVAELARRHGMSVGAMRARLTRLRGRLRLEYVLVHRRIESLPTPDCRPALEALASGDAAKIDRRAREHLKGCAVCATLEPPLRRRIRGLAALVGAAGVGRLLVRLREHPVATTGAIAATSLATVAAFALAPQGHKAVVVQATPASTSTTVTTTTTTPQVSVRARKWPTRSGVARPNDPITARRLLVTAVPSAQMLRSRADDGRRITIRLKDGPVPENVTAGSRISVTGAVIVDELRDVVDGLPDLEIRVSSRALRLAGSD